MRVGPMRTVGGERLEREKSLRRGANYNRSTARAKRRMNFCVPVGPHVARMQCARRSRSRWCGAMRRASFGRAFAFSAISPNSIARVNARFAGGSASSRVSANPRGQRTSARSLPKTPTRPCVNAMPAQRSALRRARVAREHRARRPAPREATSMTACASSKASRSPRLKPCPATGCSVCAALPSTARAARRRVAARIRAPAETCGGSRHARRPSDARRERCRASCARNWRRRTARAAPPRAPESSSRPVRSDRPRAAAPSDPRP